MASARARRLSLTVDRGSPRREAEALAVPGPSNAERLRCEKFIVRGPRPTNRFVSRIGKQRVLRPHGYALAIEFGRPSQFVDMKGSPGDANRRVA